MMDLKERLRNESQRNLLLYDLKRNYFSRYFIYRMWNKYISKAMSIITPMIILGGLIYWTNDSYQSTFSGENYIIFESFSVWVGYLLLTAAFAFGMLAYSFENKISKPKFKLLKFCLFLFVVFSLVSLLNINKISESIIAKMPAYEVCHRQKGNRVGKGPHPDIFILAKKNIGCKKVQSEKIHDRQVYLYVDQLNREIK